MSTDEKKGITLSKEAVLQIAESLDPVISFLEDISEEDPEVRKLANELADRLVSEGMLDKEYEKRSADAMSTNPQASITLAGDILSRLSNLRDKVANNLGQPVGKKANEDELPQSEIVWKRGFGSGRLSVS